MGLPILDPHTSLYKLKSLSILSAIQGIFLGVQLVGHKVVLGLTSWGNTKLFPRAIVLSNIPISSTREFQLLQLSNLRVSKGEGKELPGHNLRKINLVPLKCREGTSLVVQWPKP